MRRPSSWASLFAIVLLSGFLPACGGSGSGGGGLGLNASAAFGWRQYAETDLDFQEFWDADCTITARIMLQYPTAYAGPILSASYSSGFTLSKVAHDSYLSLRLLYGTSTYSSAPLQRGTWHHVAIVRRSDLVYLYVDGDLVCPDDPGGCVAYPGVAAGVLRFGRTAITPPAGIVETQHYGFIDDAAVFELALSESEIQMLAAKPRLDGTEAGLYAAYTFDQETPDKQELPPHLARPVTYWRVTPDGPVAHPHPFGAIVSQSRDSTLDAKLLPAPGNQVPLTLPLPSGQAWLVSQGWEGTASHYNRAAFAWDFILAGQPVTATQGAPFYAAAPGTVVEVLDNKTSCSGWPANHVDVEHAPDEYGVYLHHVQYTAAVTTGQAVGTGTYLADTGDTGNSKCNFPHIHFALHNRTESQAGLVTIPGAFENYEVSTDEGATWKKVVRGVPKQGEWVRNP